MDPALIHAAKVTILVTLGLITVWLPLCIAIVVLAGAPGSDLLPVWLGGALLLMMMGGLVALTLVTAAAVL